MSGPSWNRLPGDPDRTVHDISDDFGPEGRVIMFTGPTPDWVMIPNEPCFGELAGKQARVETRSLSECPSPTCDSEAQLWELVGPFACFECMVCSTFYWIRK